MFPHRDVPKRLQKARKWERTNRQIASPGSRTPNGFIAYPEGWREQPQRYGRLTPYLAGQPGQYTWSVNYDGQAIANIADNKQAASDAANDAWSRVVEMARKAAARAEWERHTREMIAKAERGEIDPSYFANKAAEYENMMWVMDRIKPRNDGAQRIAAGLQRVVDAISAEFFRRRNGK